MINSKIITLSSEVVQCEGNIATDMDGETVIMSIQNGKYYNLGDIGGMIWGKLKTQKTIDDLIENIMKEYDVEREVCEIQVVEFLNKMVEESLIYIVE